MTPEQLIEGLLETLYLKYVSNQRIEISGQLAFQNPCCLSCLREGVPLVFLLGGGDQQKCSLWKSPGNQGKAPVAVPSSPPQHQVPALGSLCNPLSLLTFAAPST